MRKLILLVNTILLLAISGCDYFRPYENPACARELDKDKLICYMGTQKRWGSDVYYFVVSDDLRTDLHQVLPLFINSVRERGGYLALGGLKESDAISLQNTSRYLVKNRFRADGLHIQLFLEQSDISKLIENDLEFMGATVDSYNIGRSADY